MKKFLKSLININTKYGKDNAVVIPKIQPEDIESVEFLSIKNNTEDKFLKDSKIKEIVKAFNFAVGPHRLGPYRGKPLICHDNENMMNIQLRIFLTNNRSLIIWHSSTSDEMLVVSYSTPKLKVAKYIESPNLGAILNLELG